MKTYLYDTKERYKRFRESLDVKTIICNKSWNIFNDSGEKEIYIFQEDGSLILSNNGKVINGTWKYIPANKSIIINGSDQSYMLHPTFMDEIIFVLQVDGTQQCAFLIDENNKQSFKPKTYAELLQYFEDKEQKRLNREGETEKQRQIEAKQSQEKEERQNAFLRQQEKTDALRRELCTYKGRFLVTSTSFLLFFGISIAFWVNYIDYTTLFQVDRLRFFLWGILAPGIISAILGGACSVFFNYIHYIHDRKKINEWIAKNPNDKRGKHLQWKEFADYWDEYGICTGLLQ